MERIEHDMEENDKISKFVVLCYNAFTVRLLLPGSLKQN